MPDWRSDTFHYLHRNRTPEVDFTHLIFLVKSQQMKEINIQIVDALTNLLLISLSKLQCISFIIFTIWLLMLCFDEKNRSYFASARKSICERTGSRFYAPDFSRQINVCQAEQIWNRACNFFYTSWWWILAHEIIFFVQLI